jgi:hypothetical protein
MWGGSKEEWHSVLALEDFSAWWERQIFRPEVSKLFCFCFFLFKMQPLAQAALMIIWFPVGDFKLNGSKSQTSNKAGQV